MTHPKIEIYSSDLQDRQLLANWNTTTQDIAKTYFADTLFGVGRK